jgi:hypothetical protein
MATSIVTYQIINILGILIWHFNFDFDKYKINIIKLLILPKKINCFHGWTILTNFSYTRK